MGRRPTAYREKPRVRNRWTRADTVDLLSKHEFLIERLTQDGRLNRSSKDEFLQRLQSTLKKRSKGQINNKLLHIWQVSTDGESRGEFSDVYRIGISCMVHLDDSLRKDVEERLHVFRKQEMSDYLRSPRATRSASRHPYGEKSHSIRGQIPLADCTPSKGVRKRQRECLPSESQSLLQKENLTTEDTISIRRSRTPSQVAVVPTSMSIVDTESSFKNPQSFDTYTQQNDHNVGILPDIPPVYSDSRSLFDATKLRNGRVIDYDGHDTMQPFPEICIQSSNIDTLQDLFSDNVYFRSKWLAAVEECRRLQDQNRIRYSQQSMATPTSSPTTIDIMSNGPSRLHNVEISKLLEPFRKLGEGTPEPSIVKEVGYLHEKLRREFRCLLAIEGIRLSVSNSSSIESKDFRDLKWRVFNDVDLTSWPLDDTSHDVGLVIQSFTGAAICDWVFSTELRCAATMDTPLHEKFRELLRTICGDIALRNLDFGAHQSLISDDHFQTKFIPRTARKLVTRLLDAFGPLVAFKQSQVRAELEGQLKFIFQLALKIKSLVMTSTATFGYMWPARNAAFTKDIMIEPRKASDAGRGHSKRKLKMVELALVPGLRVYSTRKESVDYCGFITGDEEGLNMPSVVAHAVVTVK